MFQLGIEGAFEQHSLVSKRLKAADNTWRVLGDVYEYVNDLGYGEGVGHEVHPVGGRVGVAEVRQREGEGGGQQEHLTHTPCTSSVIRNKSNIINSNTLLEAAKAESCFICHNLGLCFPVCLLSLCFVDSLQLSEEPTISILSNLSRGHRVYDCQEQHQPVERSLVAQVGEVENTENKKYFQQVSFATVPTRTRKK